MFSISSFTLLINSLPLQLNEFIVCVLRLVKFSNDKMGQNAN